MPTSPTVSCECEDTAGQPPPGSSSPRKYSPGVSWPTTDPPTNPTKAGSQRSARNLGRAKQRVSLPSVLMRFWASVVH